MPAPGPRPHLRRCTSLVALSETIVPPDQSSESGAGPLARDNADTRPPGLRAPIIAYCPSDTNQGSGIGWLSGDLRYTASGRRSVCSASSRGAVDWSCRTRCRPRARVTIGQPSPPPMCAPDARWTSAQCLVGMELVEEERASARLTALCAVPPWGHPTTTPTLLWEAPVRRGERQPGAFVVSGEWSATPIS